MTVRFEVFRSRMLPWDRLFEDASSFATSVGKERLITITTSADQGEGIVVVWYWDVD